MTLVDNTPKGTGLFQTATDGQVIGGLLTLYNRQEVDERAYQGTVHQNGAGFNMIDAGILSDMSQFYLNKGYLSPKQIAFLRGRLAKYARQLGGDSAELPDMPNKWAQREAERAAPAPAADPAAPVSSGRTVTMVGTLKLTIKFPYDPRLVDEVKRMTGRRWDSDMKHWTVPAGYETAKRLLELGFEFCAQTTHWWNRLTNKKESPSIAFSLCPLYTLVNKEGGWEDAKRSLREEAQCGTGRSNAGELCQGAHAGSARQGHRDTNDQRPESRMEGACGSGYAGSHAQAGSTGETPCRTGSSAGQIRTELQRRERTGADRHSETGGVLAGALRICARVSGENETARGHDSRCAHCLQNRLCPPPADDSRRTGRPQPSGTRSQGAGQEEGPDAECPWLGCATLEARLKGSLWSRLFNYQKDGVEWLNSQNGRGLLADSMGLGKTWQAVGWVYARRETSLPAIVVCPASLKINWQREFAGLTDLRVEILAGTKPGVLPKADVYIINYDIVKNWQAVLEGAKPQTLICDESHNLKTRDTQRTLVICGGEKRVKDPRTKQTVVHKIRGLSEGIPHIICLSGTPILNRPVEMYTTLKMIQPDLFPSFWKYAERYCDAKNDGYGWDFSGHANTEELHGILTKTIMLRRQKRDVLRDLPPKIRMVVPMTMADTWAREYRRAVNDFASWIKSRHGKAAAEAADRAEALVKIEKLKQLAFKGKLNSCMEWINDYLEQNDKLVIFAVHKEVLDTLETAYAGHCVRVDGDVSMAARQDAVDSFQNNPGCRVFLGNIKAAGVGLTLTAASATCFLEFPWSPGVLCQAEDRVHRIGQEADSVFAYSLVAAETIEEDIMNMLDRKSQTIGAILDNADVEEGSVFGELLRCLSSLP